jgi:ferrous iron transport protein B
MADLSPSNPAPQTDSGSKAFNVSSKEPKKTFALIGNPNCGKTTLFNSLTGMRQKVGNYPGVTVERKEGECFSQHGERFRIIDLPGSYSLNAHSPDEATLRDVLLGRRRDTVRPDVTICVVDASNLERNLYLTTQVLELGLPAILVLNMVDVAKERGFRIDIEALEQSLGIPVVTCQAHHGIGVTELKIAMSRTDISVSKFKTTYSEAWNRIWDQATQKLSAAGVLHGVGSPDRLEALYLLTDHDPTHYGLSKEELAVVKEVRADLDTQKPQWEETLAPARYEAIQVVCDIAVRPPDEYQASLTDRLDSVLLHWFWGWVSLAVIMIGMFSLIFSYAEVPMGWIEGCFSWLADRVRGMMGPGELRDLIIDGALEGVSGVLVFLPQILILFFFIGIMEGSGYMARVAFIMDRLMSRVGLNGKSFIPLLSSYACAVPGILATRTVESPRDRLLTILVAPLASCSARLPVYLLMIATLIPSDRLSTPIKVGFMLGLYALGTLGVFFFAYIFNRLLFKKEEVFPMILELPSYKWPTWKSLVLYMWERAWMFIRRAGTIILAISILLWFLLSYPKQPDAASPAEQMANSYGGMAGKTIEPVLKPLGYNWKIGIGVIASFAAREVFVSTMAIIYNVEEGEDEEMVRLQLRDQFQEDTWPNGEPVFTTLTCLSLLVFYVFAMQCVSTLAVTKRETQSWKWPIFQFVYMSITAYLAAWIVFQGGQWLGFH